MECLMSSMNKENNPSKGQKDKTKVRRGIDLLIMFIGIIVSLVFIMYWIGNDKPIFSIELIIGVILFITLILTSIVEMRGFIKS
jgi:magnesium-transporting ATPase (P-type)